ncbi:helix-turn-helix domain-containing protein [Devosia sp.]|uniref:helix-turn-helix domain-containing protein n=1 Tax=Devosia sp. TaxID=1871048 RepID=UPI003A93ED72
MRTCVSDDHNKTDGARRRATKRQIRKDARTRHLLAIVGRRHGVARRQLLNRRRCRKHVAFARQLGMYLMHVALSRPYSDVGAFFGRDRTTVTHACARIEDMRDDPAFDAEVALMEEMLAEVSDAL